MQKVSLIIHQNYLEDVVKNLHETGLMEIIDISREEPTILENVERATMHPDSEALTTYELRLTRLIDILKRIKPKKSGIKALLNPELPEKKEIDEHNIDELFSYVEGILSEIEQGILAHENKLHEFNERIEIIKNDVDQLNYIYDIDFDISSLKESEYIIVKAGLTKDLDDLNFI